MPFSPGIEILHRDRIKSKRLFCCYVACFQLRLPRERRDQKAGKWTRKRIAGNKKKKKKKTHPLLRGFLLPCTPTPPPMRQCTQRCRVEKSRMKRRYDVTKNDPRFKRERDSFAGRIFAIVTFQPRHVTDSEKYPSTAYVRNYTRAHHIILLRVKKYCSSRSGRKVCISYALNSAF